MRNCSLALALPISTLLAISFASTASGQEKPACSPLSEKIYFPDGFDRGDGMGAYIDFEGRKMAVADQVFPLEKCKSNLSKVCFISEYFTFSSRHYKDVATWSENGYKFMLFGGGHCGPQQCKNSPPDTHVIFSRQKEKDIMFYYSDRCGLTGWKVTWDPDEDGFVEIEDYSVPAYIPDKEVGCDV